MLHVSQLKKHVPKDTVVSEDLSSVGIDPIQVLQPLKILQSRVIKKGAKMIKQILVQWDKMTPELATWEDEADVPRQQVQIIAA